MKVIFSETSKQIFGGPTRRRLLPSELLHFALLCVMLSIAGQTPAQSSAVISNLPEHMTPEAVEAIDKGLAYLARTQSDDGSWRGTSDGSAYPVSMASLAGMAFLANGNTPSRGPYADELSATVRYVISEARPDGLISVGNSNGRTMYGHGFGLLFLATTYGMETDARIRKRMHTVIEKAIKLTGQAQSPRGGWYYTPNSGDEGSVTVTQLQALRAAQNAGFTVPQDIIDKAIHYLEICQGPEGGIVYSYGSRGGSRLPISAAAITCLYSAGEYDSPLAEACIEFVWSSFKARSMNWNIGGHAYYGHYYAAQSFYQAGDDYWAEYFPPIRDQLIKNQNKDGHWTGDGIGPTYGTALACTILQLPYKYLPIYQR